MISPGPRWSLNEAFFQRLNQDYEGALLTTASDSQILETKKIANFQFHCGKFRERFRSLSNIIFFFFCMRFAIGERLKGVKYDLVVTYDPIKTGIIGVFVSAILKAKFAPEVNGVYTSDAEYIDGGESFSVKVKKVIIPVIMRFVIKRADGIKLLFDDQLAPFSEYTKGKCIARFANYVAIDKFRNLSEEKVILFVGFPFKRKGLDLLIKAFKQVSDAYPDWRLKILGWYPNKEELDRAIDGHSAISHHPPVLHNEMSEHVGRCGFLVLPSRSEAMGRILVESMAAGKPRIGANVDGIPTVITHDVDGLLFESENIEDLSRKLSLLMGDDSLRKRLGEAAGNRAQSEFSQEVFFANKLKFYSDVVNGCSK